MDIIVITPTQLKEIVKECLADLQNTNQILTTPEHSKNLYSLRELANFLGCSSVTVQKLKNSGKIRYKQFGRKCVFNTSEVLEDLSQKSGKTLSRTWKGGRQ